MSEGKAKYLIIVLLLILSSIRIGSLHAKDLTPIKPEEISLGIRLNDIEEAPSIVLLFPDKSIWVSKENLLVWRIREPKVSPYIFQAHQYFSLKSISGLTYQVNEEKQELEIKANPEVFLSYVMEGIGNPMLSPSRSPLGAFFNYDLLGQRSHSTTSESNINGSFEAGLFSRLGVFTHTFLGQNLNDSKKNYVRLDSTWTYDRPTHLSSYRAGDAITQGGSWGRPVRFAGVQWATNFNTQPGFISYPVPSFRGETALPSTVDVFINNNFRSHNDVPAGPFEIPNVPLVSGQGNVQLVVRDLLGREKIITQPYYVTPLLLRKNLNDFSYEIGSIRQNYGLESNKYGSDFISLTHRYGLTENLTTEFHSELLNELQNVGLGSAYLVPTLGTFSAAVAGSKNSIHQSGGQLLVGFDRQSNSFGIGGHAQYFTENFAQLGQLSGAQRFRQITSAYFGFSPSGADSISLSYANQQYRGQPGTQIETINYSTTLFKKFFASLFGSITENSFSDYTIGINLSCSLDNLTTTNLGATKQKNSNENTLQIQRNLTDEPSVGYRLFGEQGTQNQAQAELDVQRAYGNFTAAYSRIFAKNQQSDIDGYRLGASGGLAFMDGSVFASRTLSDSFAVAKVDQYPNITVYKEHRPVGKTGSDGTFLIPKLRAYDINHIGIEQADLPIDAQVETTEMEIAPYYRSGVLADFHVSSSKSALIKVRLEDGSELPAGATVKLGKKEFPVGFHGEVYVTDLESHNFLEANWNDQRCEFTVDVPANTGPLPILGPFICKGVKH